MSVKAFKRDGIIHSYITPFPGDTPLPPERTFGVCLKLLEGSSVILKVGGKAAMLRFSFGKGVMLRFSQSGKSFYAGLVVDFLRAGQFSVDFLRAGFLYNISQADKAGNRDHVASYKGEGAKLKDAIFRVKGKQMSRNAVDSDKSSKRQHRCTLRLTITRFSRAHNRRNPSKKHTGRA